VSAIQCSTVQYSAVQYNTVQYSTIQCSTVQYSAVQCNLQIQQHQDHRLDGITTYTKHQLATQHK